MTAYLVRPDGGEDGRYEGLFNHSAQTYSLLAPHFRPSIRLMQGYRGSKLVTLAVVAAFAMGWYGWGRVDEASQQAARIQSRSPFCQPPDPRAWMSAADRRAAQAAFDECKAQMPAIWAEYRKASQTQAKLLEQRNHWAFMLVACALTLLGGWVLRIVRRSGHSRRTWQEYLEKLEAIVGTGRVS